MQDIKLPTPKKTEVVRAQQPVLKAPQKRYKKIKFKISLQPIVNFWRWLESHESQARIFAGTMALLMVFSIALEIGSPAQKAKLYDISNYQGKILQNPVDLYGQKLELNNKTGAYDYNAGYTPATEVAGTTFTPKITASFGAGDTKTVTVTDPTNSVNVSLTPKFKLLEPQKDKNYVIYPVKGLDAKVVYTAKAGSIKEDIILDKYQKDELHFTYDVGTSEGTELRSEDDGSVAVYGVQKSLLGSVSTGSEKDAELLKKARQNGEKNVLLFKIPAPFIVQADKKQSSARTWYSVKGNELTVHAASLKNASYPLSIDPSVYVESATKLMRGNNESNIDFDVSNDLIQKSQTTGARIDGWNDTTEMSSGTWDQAVATAGGYVYRAGGRVDPTMPYVVGQQSTVLASNNTSFVMNMPTTRPAGDLYVAIIAHDGSGTNVVPPAGWTEYADTREHAAYYKEGTDQGGGNESATYTWTGASEQWVGTILRIKGFNAGSPVSGTAGTGSSASAVVPIFPTTTPSHDATLIIRSVGVNADQPAEFGWLPSGHTKVYSDTSSTDTANSAALMVVYMDQPPLATVATGTTTLANDGLVNDTYGASSIAIRPATVTAGYQTGVQWAKFNTSTGSIDSPNPGTGTCTGWCNNSVYNLPEARIGMSMVAYNGYLYATGGSDGANRESTVWIAKIGVNGEPQLWHPTDSNKTNWVYWYSDTGLNGAVARSYHTAYAYNNRMYILGGQTNASTGGVTTVEIADFAPNGLLRNWTTTGTQVLPDVRHSFSVHIYNDVMYLIGGNSNGTLRNTVYYSKLITTAGATYGNMNSWVSTSAFTTARSSFGGTMTGLWGAYIYLAGGCTTLSGAYCSVIGSDVQLASINADGSIAEWNGILNLSNQRIGHSFVAWQNGLYRFGGCNRQNTSTGVCYATHRDVEYGVVNPDGDASTVSNSEPANTAPCSGASPVNCDLPGAGDGAQQGGQMASAIAINNGFIYVIGGCTSVASGDVCETGGTANSSGNTMYAALDSQGRMAKAAACTGGTFVTNSLWCVDSTNTLNGTTGLSATSATVFNNTIYVAGGTTGSNWQNNVYRVGLNADGSLTGAWATQDFNTDLGLTGTADDERGYMYTFARANPSAAATNPGNYYMLGGCVAGGGATGDGLGCGTYYTDVIKCNIGTSGALNGCTTTGQLQIDADNINGGNQGLGLMAGTIYANRIYLVGGACTEVGAADDPCGSNYSGNRKDTIYARIDNSNNIVAESGGVWLLTSGQMSPVRRRAVAFGYNGYIYSLAGYSGTSSLQDLLFAKINVSTGDMGDFDSSGVVVTPRWDLRAIVGNGYVYAVGGCATGAAPSSCTAMQPEVQTFQLYNNDSGTPALYSAVTDDTFATDTDRIGASAAVLNGYIYVAGGCTNIGCTTATANVQYALLDASNGTISGATAWTNATNGLTAARAWGQLEAAAGYLYYLGGQTATATDERSEVYYVGAFTSGNITGAWATALGGIGDTASQAAQERTKFGATVWNNRIYVVGGLNVSAANTNTVYISPILTTSGGIAANSWAEDTDTLNVARRGNTLVAYGNNLYSFGGNNGTEYFNDSQYTTIGYKTGTIAQSGTTVTGTGTTFTAAMVGSTVQYPDGSTATITAYTNATTVTVNASKSVSAGAIYTINDGSISAWSYSSSLPTPISEAEGFAANGYIYLVGGRSATSTCAPNTIMAPISANTTIAAGNNPTGVGDWYETNQKYTGDRYGAAVAYSSGKLIVLGGGCSALVTSGRHWYSALKSQPQIAKYSRLIDTDTNVFPNSWLLNGIDNSIGSRWQATYRSAIDASNIIHQQSFDDGTNGTNVTTGSSSYDTCYANGALTNQYSNAQFVTSGLSMRLNVPSTSGNGGCEDQFANATTVRYDRFYVRFDAYAGLSANTTIYDIDNDGAGEDVAGVRITTGGTLQLRDKFTTEATTAALAASTWHRIEIGLVSDQMTVRTFEGSNVQGTTPTQTFTITLDNAAVNDFDSAALGIIENINSGWGMYIDEHTASSSTWVGPAYPDWGQSTSVPDVALGDVMTYTPKDAAGANTSFARWYFFNINIDASQTFGYPEDISRGPTITDLSLFFTADPNKRLRHGKTFTGGEQQPLDTPCRQTVDAQCPLP